MSPHSAYLLPVITAKQSAIPSPRRSDAPAPISTTQAHPKPALAMLTSLAASINHGSFLESIELTLALQDDQSAHEPQGVFSNSTTNMTRLPAVTSFEPVSPFVGFVVQPCGTGKRDSFVPVL